MKNLKKGFIQTPVLIGVIFASLIIVGAGYLSYKSFHSSKTDQINNESKDDEINKLRNDLEAIKAQQLSQSSKQPAEGSTQQSKKITPPKVSNEIQTSPSPEIQSSVQVTEPVKTEMKEEEKVSGPKFEITQVTQTIFKGRDFYTYGGYQVNIKVSAGSNEIYIPMTTTDSTQGLTGFIYSIKGDDFSGEQKSQVSCNLMHGKYCKIAANSSQDISVVIWLTPNSSGNYSVRFDSMSFLEGTSEDVKSFSIERETQKIYLDH